MVTIKAIGLVCLISFFLVDLFSAGYPRLLTVRAAEAEYRPSGYAGTQSCRECHEKFYQLWAPSHHGLAMQPYTDIFAQGELTPQSQDIVIEDYRYRAETGPGQGWVLENGPGGQKKYPIQHVLGGKYVYYFLTPMERGRLQTLPVAYDVDAKVWFDMAASGVRHFTDRPDEPVNWREWPYTFNTGCYGCHVSQLSTNYDLETDTYHTTWAEPGINCETCHGPADEHNRVCREAPKGTVPKDLKITRGGRDFTPEQNNAACATCHTKGAPVTSLFSPGDRYFDHFDLICLEHPDFYPDGRDLGENYTYTLWLLSPCVKSGELACTHCHTSSGRFKQKKDPNQSCLPCHQERVDHASDHSHHPEGSKGNLCISCHMPMTEFARMRRSDHSMLPPTPAATIAFDSPNACNICHSNRDAAWADGWVRTWRDRDYQAPVLHRASLIATARKRDWSRLPDMLPYISSPDRDEIYATSLIRLLAACGDMRKWPVILKAMEDPSPLVRSAAAASLSGLPSQETGEALVKACGDDYRLVRLRAAGSLAGYPTWFLKDEDRKQVETATREYLASLISRPDHWTSHYNLGNYYLKIGALEPALAAYETAETFDPRNVMPLVNASIVHARMGNEAEAEASLNKGLSFDPENAAVNFNMGLLKAEHGETVAAETHLRMALKSDPQMHQAAFNLGVLLVGDRTVEAMELILKAFELHPTPKYAYTLAFYMRQNNDSKNAAQMLEHTIEHWPYYAEAYMLLGDIYETLGQLDKAKRTYEQALDSGQLSTRDRYRFQTKIQTLEPGGEETGNTE
jgi:tetratricopeptide (TPR) repeat protein